MVFALAVSLVVALTLLLPPITFMLVLRLRQQTAAIERRLRAIEAVRLVPAAPAEQAAREAAPPPVTPPSTSRPDEGGRTDPIVPPVLTVADVDAAAREPAGPVPPAVTPTEGATPPPPSSRLDSGIEARIGARWMLGAGVIVVLFGIGFFVKFAIDNAWATPVTRVAGGAVAGLLLIVFGAAFVRRGYVAYGRVVTGGGFAALYLSAYAAHATYGLLDRGPAFLLLAIVSVAAALAADRDESPGLALFAVCGGFLAPLFLAGRDDQQVALFSYDLVLGGLTLALAERRSWPQLNLASFLLTLWTVSSWADSYYRPDRYLSTTLFATAFCILYALILRRNLASRHPWAPVVTMAFGLGLLAYHAFEVRILQPHAVPFLVYEVTATAVVVGVARAAGRSWLRAAAAVIVLLPFFQWLSVHLSPAWMVAALASLTAIYVLHLVATADAVSKEVEPLDAGDVAAFHLTGTALFGGTYAVMNATHPGAAGPVAFGLAGWNYLLAQLWRRGSTDASLQAAALGSACLAAAMAIEFPGPWATAGWAVEAAALIWIAVGSRRRWLEAGAGLLLAGAVGRAIVETTAAPSVSFVPVLNVAFVSGAIGVAALHVVSWVYRRRRGDDRTGRVAAGVAAAGGHLLMLLVGSGQIDGYWQAHQAAHNAALARELMLSLYWAVYAMGLLIVGMKRSRSILRYLALAIFTATLAKVFTVDFSALGGLYRIAAFVLVGLSLLWGSFLYQQRLRRRALDN